MNEEIHETNTTVTDEAYMLMAIRQAREATRHGDVPVGAVLVNPVSGEILAASHNTRERDKNVTGHAELNVIQEASEKIKDWRLSDCTLYVTLEPCPMCAGAIMAARIQRVVCASKDPMAGAMGSVWSLHSHPVSKDIPSVTFGCCEEEATQMLKNFFTERRRE